MVNLKCIFKNMWAAVSHQHKEHNKALMIIRKTSRVLTTHVPSLRRMLWLFYL